MCRRGAWLLLLYLLFPVANAVEGDLKSWAYVASWMGESWRDAKIEEIDRLLFFEIKIDANGLIHEASGWPERWQSLNTAAMEAKRPLDIVLTIFSVDAFNELFSDRKKIQQFIDTALALADNEGVSGLQLDVELYEGASPVALRNYQRFVKNLSESLGKKQPARQLSAFYPMGEVPLYEPATLRYLSGIVFQGYDAHWLSGPHAGPVAPLKGEYMLTWEKVDALIRRLEIEGIPTLISFPLYGYEWPVKSAAAQAATSGVGAITTFASFTKEFLPDLQINLASRLENYGAVHDPASGSAYYKFTTANDEWTEGWFEDWWTLGQKINFVCAKKISGIAFFPLGYDRNELVNFYQRRRSCQN